MAPRIRYEPGREGHGHLWAFMSHPWVTVTFCLILLAIFLTGIIGGMDS